MALYSVTQIIGKSLYAKKDVQLKRSAFDATASVYTVKKGSLIGVVQTYVLPREGRKNLYWEFQNSYGVTLYCEHKEGNFSLTKLLEQGVISVKEEIEAKKEAETESTKDGFDKTKEIANIGLFAVAIWGGVMLAKTLKSN